MTSRTRQGHRHPTDDVMGSIVRAMPSDLGGTKWNWWKVIIILLTISVLLLNVQILLLMDGSTTRSDDMNYFECIRKVNLSIDAIPLSAEEARRLWFQTHQGQGRELLLARSTKGFLTIAIPVKRIASGPIDYLGKTLDTLIEHTSTADKLNNTVVVFLFGDDHSNSEIVNRLTAKYMYYINIGFLRLVQPTEDYTRRAETNLKAFLSSQRNMTSHIANNVEQIVRHQFMYQYAYDNNPTSYYLQYTDDVLCSDYFLYDIRVFIKEQKGEWSMLEFSETEYIGKVLKVSQLRKLSRMMSLFHSEQQISHILPLFAASMAQTTRRIYTPSIFELIEADLVSQQKFRHGASALLIPGDDVKKWHSDDPPGVVVTSLRADNSFPPRLAYGSESGFFWAQNPKRDDWVKVIFQPPVVLDKVIVETGSSVFPQDILLEGKLGVSSTQECGHLREIASFDRGRVEVTRLNETLKLTPTACLQITILEAQERWIVFQQIAVFVYQQEP